MTMHMCGPALSLNGKKKGKVKFRNAAEAQKARELDAEWKELLKRQGVEAEKKKQARAMIIGIAVMHKSCLQPMFNKQAAEDSAHMRR